MENDIVKQARTWLGTPFHHQARVKNVGCDCLGLFIGISKELNLKSHVIDAKGESVPLANFDNITYSTDPNTDKLIGMLNTYLNPIDKSDMNIGDIVLIKVNNSPRHLGIVTDYLYGGFGLLHSLHGSGVIEHGLDKNWLKNIYKVYRLK